MLMTAVSEEEARSSLGASGPRVQGRTVTEECDVDVPGRGSGEPSAQDTGGSDGRDGLAVLFSDFARDVQEQTDPHATLTAIVRAAVELIPGCDEGSISVVRCRRTVTSEAASGELPRVVDALQETVQQGPCPDAVYEQETVRVAEMASETRWPKFATRAHEAGALGMLSIQLYVEGDNLGALNLFSAGPCHHGPPPSSTASRRRFAAAGAARMAEEGSSWVGSVRGSAEPRAEDDPVVTDCEGVDGDG